MTPMMSLVIGWSIVGGFVFTLAVTLLSLLGWVKFADAGQQKKLFTTLIVGVVVAAGAGLVSGAKLDAGEVEQEIKDDERLATANDMLNKGAAGAAIDKQVLESVVGNISPKAGTARARQVDELRSKVAALPAGRIGADQAAALHNDALLQAHRMRVPVKK